MFSLAVYVEMVVFVFARWSLLMRAILLPFEERFVKVTVLVAIGDSMLEEKGKEARGDEGKTPSLYKDPLGTSSQCNCV